MPKTALLLLLSLATLSLSRKLDFVAQISAHAHSYHPRLSKYRDLLSLEPNETLPNYEVKNITGLGMRQAYLLGQELRRRYISEYGSVRKVEELTDSQGFLGFSYRVQEFYTRTSGNSQSFISANAQLLGMYPPETCNQKMTDWQIENVRPPLMERVTDEEIRAIGQYATKGGITPFDIFNQYETEDQMNIIDGIGCPRYAQIRDRLRESDEYNQFKQALVIELNPIILKATKTYDFKTYEDALEFCRFLEDAWLDGFTLTQDLQYEEGSILQDACVKYLRTEAYLQVLGHREMAVLKASEMAQLVVAKMVSTIEKNENGTLPEDLQANLTYLWKTFDSQMKFGHMQHLNETKWISLVGEAWNLKSFLYLVSRQYKWDYVQPSSMVLLEVYDDMTVMVTFNDKPVKLREPCSNLTDTCHLPDFIRMLHLEGVVMDKGMRFVCGADFFQRRDPDFEALPKNATLTFLNPMEPLLKILGSRPQDVIDRIK